MSAQNSKIANKDRRRQADNYTVEAASNRVLDRAGSKSSDALPPRNTKTRRSADADNGLDAFSGQSR